MKKVYGEKHSFIELTYVVGAHWNCLNGTIPMCRIALMRQLQCVPTTYFAEIKKNIEIYTKQVSCPLTLPLLTISNCQTVLKYLFIVYIYMTSISQSLIS